MTRAVLYARYSSDNQRQASIEDQLRLCCERAEREGWQIVECYTDAAISGASMTLRPGIETLLTYAQDARFDVVVLAEALDRLSRDRKTLRHCSSGFASLAFVSSPCRRERWTNCMSA
jgi:site-specific DNA recombinase